MDKNFITLNNEVSFARSCLGLGLTQIRKANYAELGIYWQAFTNLSVGLERLAKLVILLDYLIHNNGNYPDFETLKRYGHNLNKLYKISQEISNRNSIKFNYYSELNEYIHINILDVLNNFAKGERYANLDFLTGASNKNPVSDWSLKIDDWIWDNQITKNKKEVILKNASLWKLMPFHCYHITETNQIIRDAVEASILTGKFEAVAPYRVLYTVQIIRYWSELLRELQYLCHIKQINTPSFSEHFSLFLTDDSYIKGRKDFTKRY